MLRQFSSKRIITSFLFDWLGTILALLLATYIRTVLESATWASLAAWVGGGSAAFGEWPLHVIVPQVILLVAVIWPIFFILFSVYDGRRSENLIAELRNVFLAIVTASLVLAGVLFLTFRGTSRLLFLIFVALDLAILLSGRVVWYAYRARWDGEGRPGHHRVLIVGAGSTGVRVARELLKYTRSEVHMVGFVDDDPAKQAGDVAGLPVLGTTDRVLDVAQDYEVRDAIIALPLRAHERLIEISRILQKSGVRVHVIPDLFVLSFPNAALDGFGGIPVIDLGQPGIQGQQRLVKRVFDLLVSSLTLLIISPVLLLIALLIELDSRGPVLYRQDRIGENGQLFTMYKFRSMLAGAESDIHQAHVTHLIRENIDPKDASTNDNGSLKLDDDPRITRVGRFIRKTSLDELPQLFNVLQGNMSLVGPRPPLPYEVEVYREWHMRRFEVPPGITGLWQVKGRNLVSFDEMVRMDLEYIENYTIWMDISILLQTPWAVINTRGAA